MKKSLLLATLLLTSAAQAGTYGCNSHDSASIGISNYLDKDPDRIFLINTSTGEFSERTRNESQFLSTKQLECKKHENVLTVCVSKVSSNSLGPQSIEQFILHTDGRINFFFTEVNIPEGLNISYAGSCAELD